MTTPAPIARMTSDLVREMRTEQDERAAFETWTADHYKITNPGPLTRLDGGRYFYGPVNQSWLAWQARASLAPAPQPASALASVREPLSDEEIATAVAPLYGSEVAAEMGLQDDIRTARAIEAALGITAQAQQEGK